jgi:threonine dehydratase
VGGGGLKLGLLLGSMYGAAYARAAGIEVPFEVEFVGVQMHGGDPARRAVDRYRAGLPCDRLEDLYENDALIDKRNDGTFAVPGSITLPLLAKAGDIELVSSDEVGQAMLQLSSRYGKKIEPAGALSFAGARAWASRHPVASDKRNRVTLVTYTTGSNVTDENFMSFKADADKAARSRQAAENERVTSWNQQHYSFLPSDDARRLSAIVEGVRTRKQRRAAQAVGTASCSRGTRVWSGPTSVK